MNDEPVIKCLLVDIDNVLISEVEEVMADIGDADCKLINPYRLNVNFETDEQTMTPWPAGTVQNEIMLRSSDILTIAEPTKEIIEKYLKLTSE
jgi:hypothetical protein